MAQRSIAVVELAPGRAGRIIDALVQCGVAAERIEVVRAHAGERPADLPGAVIGAGGPGSVQEARPGSEFGRAVATARSLLDRWLSAGVPFLGICLSHQLLALHAGGQVTTRADGTLLGFETVEAATGDGLFEGLGGRVVLAQSHHDEVTAAPPGWTVAGRSDSCGVEALCSPDGRAWSVQGHPEFPAEYMRERLQANNGASPPLRDAPGPRYDAGRLGILQNFLALAGIRVSGRAGSADG